MFDKNNVGLSRKKILEWILKAIKIPNCKIIRSKLNWLSKYHNNKQLNIIKKDIKKSIFLILLKKQPRKILKLFCQLLSLQG